MPTFPESDAVKAMVERARREGRILSENGVRPPDAPAGAKKPRKKRGRPEAEFQDAVIAYARLHGWKVVTIRPVRVARKDGSVYYQTPFGADGVGFFDTLFARERVVFAELKFEGYPGPEQKEWAARMERAGQEVYLWRPKHWSEIEKVLA